MKKSVVYLLLIITLGACSPYQNALKSDDIALKYKIADSLYNQKKYKKSLKLWEQIVPTYRGRPQAERVMYLYSDSYYQLGDYYLAGYQFERFANAYPQSEKREEASYKSSKSYYELSPRYNLDQADTDKALDKLKNFVNSYPESDYFDEVNGMIQELNIKVQKKAFEIAKQYNKISNFPASLKALDNFISEYPGSVYREGAIYYKLDSQYRYATGSLSGLVKERLESAKGIYENLIRFYPDGEYRERADEIMNNITKGLETYTENNNIEEDAKDK